MGAVHLVVGNDMRRRWRPLLTVVLLLGLGGAVVLTAIAGARRTQSAYPRLREVVRTADASVEVSRDYFDEIEALPEVDTVAPASFVFVFVPGLEEEDVLSLASVDGRFNRDVDGMFIVDGRRAAQDRADEVVIDPRTADRLGVGVGSRLTLSSLAPAQLDPLIMGEDPGAPAGPTIEITIVGLGRTGQEFASQSQVLLFTPAFYDRYREQVAHFDDILSVRLHDGVDVATLEQSVLEVVPAREGAIVETLRETSAEIQDATRVQAVALVAFALALAVALFIAVGQALARQASEAGSEHYTLQALGLTRRQRFGALLAPGVIVAVAGSAMAVVLAIAASPTMPIGFARELEPSPGVDADWLVLGAGFLVTAVLVIGRVSLSAWGTSGLRDRGSARSSWTVGWLARMGARPTLQTGVGLALEPGHGRTAVPVRPALAGAAIGVAGLVAALTFGAALRWTVTEPVAYGLTWDVSFIGPRDAGGLDDQVASLSENPATDDVAAMSVLPVRLNGLPAQSYGLEAAKGGGFVTVLDGRAPQGATEVLVGAGTLGRHDREIGDTITASPLEGSGERELTIVGRGVFPEFVHPAVPDSDTGGYDEFALLTLAGNEALGAGAGGEYFSMSLVRWAPGVDGDAEAGRLEQSGMTPMVIDRPEHFVNLERVDEVPWVIAGFLALIAAVATSHTLAMSVRRRRTSLAVLRTLGFDRRQVRATLAWQATTLGAVGLAVGVPLGLVIGRVAWTIVADGLGIAVHVPIPWLSLAAMVPAVLLLTNLLAVAPGRRATRSRPATALRTE